MPDFSAAQIPPPKNWQDFETLCWDLWRSIWLDPNTIKNGRNGQVQHGVDISGQPIAKATWAGIQCKGKDNYAKQELTVSELEDEVRKAKKFYPRLDDFIVATTGRKDARVEEKARKITERHKKTNFFSVTVLGWEDLIRLLEDYPDIIVKHYPWYGAIAWNAEACLAARHMWKHHFSSHRGAILWCPNVTAIFGNDGYTTDPKYPDKVSDTRAKEEVKLLRIKLLELGVKELGFGLDERGYTWVILVDSADARSFNSLIWTCYPISGVRLEIEQNTAWRSLHTYWNFPAKEQCLKR